MPNPVPIPLGPLSLSPETNERAESLLSAIVQVVHSGASGAGLAPTHPTVIPTEKLGQNKALALTTSIQQQHYRQLAVAIASVVPAWSTGGGGEPVERVTRTTDGLMWFQDKVLVDDHFRSLNASQRTNWFGINLQHSVLSPSATYRSEPGITPLQVRSMFGANNLSVAHWTSGTYEQFPEISEAPATLLSVAVDTTLHQIGFFKSKSAEGPSTEGPWYRLGEGVDWISGSPTFVNPPGGWRKFMFEGDFHEMIYTSLTPASNLSVFTLPALAAGASPPSGRLGQFFLNTSLGSGGLPFVYTNDGWKELGLAGDISFGSDIQPVGEINNPGTGNAAARSNHVHAHGNQGGGSLHALATTSAPGFLASEDKTKLDQMEVVSVASTPSPDGAEIYGGNVNGTVLIKRLVAGSNITIAETDDNISIFAEGGGGSTSFTATCPSSVTVGDLVRITGNRSVEEIDVTDALKMPCAGVVISKLSATTCEVQVHGLVENIWNDIIPGRMYFASPTGPSSVPPEPTTEYAFMQAIGVGVDETTLSFAPSMNITRRG